MKATPEQQAAIQAQGRPLLVDAGAGTGKTWVLVERFIYLLQEHPDWPLEGILAVTFTNKATREMRTRIRRAVEEKARHAPPGSHWHARRRELDRLSVSTIHGLCAQILRENAIAAGVDPLFQELDEVEAGLLKEEAIQQTLAGLVEAGSPALDLLVSLKARDLKGEMARLMEQRGTVQRILKGLPGKAGLLEHWAKGIEAMRRGMWQDELRANPDLEPAAAYFEHLPVADPTDLLAGPVSLARQGCQALQAGELVQALECWRQIKRTGGKPGNWGGVEALAELKAMLKPLQETGKKMDAAGCTQDLTGLDEQAAGALQLWKELWLRLESCYERLKGQRQALDFDDLEIQAEALLKAIPRSERTQLFLDGIRHLMVDEFQDTNQVQQSIVYALAHPSQGGRLFVVGDAKQSIYRFRQAQVSVFNRTGQDIQAASGQLPVLLRRSFRTQSALVAALNTLFDRVFLPGAGTFADYEARPGALQAERPSPPSQAVAPAPVEVTLIPKVDSRGDKVNSEAARLWEAGLIANRLLSLERDGFQVWDKQLRTYRPFRMSDAAVLFRATTHLPLYEEQFKAAGLPYLTVSGRGYFDRPEVQDLLALLAALYSPADDLSLAAALRSPIFALSDETLYRLRWRTSGDLRSDQPIPYTLALAAPPPTDQTQAVALACHALGELREMAGRAPVWQLLRAALDLTGYETTLAWTDAGLGAGSRQRSNLLKFIEMARARGGASLADFLRQVQDLRAREAREGEALGSAPETGAVQLMSIHAAKGLEFPVVAVPDLGRIHRSPVSSSYILHDPAFGMVCKQRDADGEWVKPASYHWGEWLNGKMEEAELRRLLYVACTRAADLLLLSGQLGNRSCWLQDMIEGWDLALDGEQDQLETRDGFAIRVLSSREPVEPVNVAFAPKTEGISLMEVPRLAEPLAPSRAGGVLPVTYLARPAGKDGLAVPELRPVVYRNMGEGRAARAPNYLVGRVVHCLLAEWSCLSLVGADLQRRLEGGARREGLSDPGLVMDAARRARRMLLNLRGQALFQEIEAAPERYCELPFSLDTPLGTVEGLIDLLYRDGQGDWRLIEWKTEWASPEDVTGLRQELLSQLALYAHAVEQTLGAAPRSSLVYLNPRLVCRDVERGALRQRLAELWEGNFA
jgi:ATP-dependent helicase/nuclease subunit A